MQTPERPEDCPWGVAGWENLYPVYTISLLNSACYKLRVYPRSYATRTKFTKPIAIWLVT